MLIPGYEVKETICEFDEILYIRCINFDERKKKILKTSQFNHPSKLELARFEQEYNICSSLKISPFLHAEKVISFEKNLAIVFQDEELKPIADFEKLKLREFVKIAKSAFKALKELHLKGLTHKSIHSRSIFWNPKKEEIKFSDLSRIAKLPKDFVYHDLRSTFDIAYISPEQTGRMNRAIDYRSDYYSLGIVLYQLLTGSLPFFANSNMEWVHAHIAKKPILPQKLSSKIPPIVSDIILKLIQKNPEERYQSIEGILFDLELCEDKEKLSADFEIYEIGKQDIKKDFQISQKIYGRDKHFKTLEKHFLENNADFIFSIISGSAGMGKTFFLSETRKSFFSEFEHTFWGSFYENNLSIPFNGFIQSIESFVDRITAKYNQKELLELKTKIDEKLADNLPLLYSLVPELQRLFSNERDIDYSGENLSEEPEDRVFFIFLKFFQCFNEKDQIAIFLDDIHFADLQSLKLLEYFCIVKPKNIKIIATYRSDSTSNNKKYLNYLDKFSFNCNLKRLFLKPLESSHVFQILDDSLNLRNYSKRFKELTETLVNITHGNPFFITEALQDFKDRKVIFYNEQSQKWDLDLDRAKKAEIKENVIEFLIGHFIQLAQEDQEILKISSCLGNQFNLEILLKVSSYSLSTVTKSLQRLFEAGYLITSDENLNFIELYNKETNSVLPVEIHFKHPRICSAAQELLSKSEKLSIHKKIADFLYDNQYFSKTHSSTDIIQIARNANLAAELYQSEEEISKILSINITAANSSKLSAAFEQMNHFAENALHLIQRNGLEKDAIGFRIKFMLCEANLFLKNYEKTEFYSEQLQKYKKNKTEFAKVIILQIEYFICLNKLEKAKVIGLSGLKELGHSFDGQISKAQLLSEKLSLNLLNKSTLQKIDSSKESIELDSHINNILNLITYVAFDLKLEKLFSYLVYKQLKFIKKSGFNEYVPVSFVFYSWLLLHHDKNSNLSIKIAEHALNKLKDIKNIKVRARANLYFASFIGPYYKPETNIDHLNKSISYASKVGAPLTEFLAHIQKIYFESKNSIFDATQTAETFVSKIKATKFEEKHQQLIDIKDFLARLGNKKYHLEFNSDELEKEKLKRLIDKEFFFAVCLHAALQLQLAFLFSHIKKGIEIVEMVETVIDKSQGFYWFVDYQIFKALLFCKAFYRSFVTKNDAIKVLQKSIKVLNKYPNNPAIRLAVHLLKAELFRLGDKTTEAINEYQKAIKSPDLLYEAISYELLADYHAKEGQDKLVQSYLKEALFIYERIGMKGKIAFLFHKDKKYIDRRLTADNFSPRTRESEPVSVDLNAVFKATKYISKELSSNQLIEKLVEVSIENAGAEKGVFIHVSDDRFWIKNICNINVPEENYTGLTALDSIIIPQKFVQYSFRKRESILSNYLYLNEKFTNDDYVKKKKLKSALCIPIIHNNDLIGGLYLENNMIYDAFNENHIKIIELIASQASVFLKNALLYESLEAEKRKVESINDSFKRFVPEAFIESLDADITKVKVGDCVQKDMTVLFCDIRSFSNMCHSMSVKHNFNFINDYLSRVAPYIEKNEGFIDKYIGDGIMALFPNVDLALKATREMLFSLDKYNEERVKNKTQAIEVGIGIHSGEVMLGAVGFKDRMDGTVIGDTVNIASRIEGLTKKFYSRVVVSEKCLNQLRDKETHHYRYIANVLVKGIYNPIKVFEVFDSDSDNDKINKIKALDFYNKGIEYFYNLQPEQALNYFEKSLSKNSFDLITLGYIDKIKKYLAEGYPKEWKGYFIIAEEQPITFNAYNSKALRFLHPEDY